MNLIAQVLITMKKNWKKAIILGFFFSLIVLLADTLEFFGSLFVLFSAYLAQELVRIHLNPKYGDLKRFYSFKKIRIALINALLFSPTGMIFGSASAMIGNAPISLATVLPAVSIFVACSYFYLIGAQGFMLENDLNLGLLKSLDSVFKTSVHQARSYLVMSLIIGFSLIVSVLSKGICFIFLWPFILLVIHFQFEEIIKKKLI